MTMVSEARMADVKAGIAAEIARIMRPKEKVEAVAKVLQVDEDEARRLIARGRRIARERASAA